MKYLLIIGMLLLNLSVLAQSYTQTIRGTVVDKTTQSTLPGASIVILGTSPIIGTTTDMDGEFKFESVELGRYNLQVSFLGYNSYTLNNLLLSSGKELVLNIQLEEQAFMTEEVVVRAEERKDQSINKMATVSARSFSVAETERYAGSLGDPSRMAANFAGVAMVNDSRNDIIIRGNSPSGLLWRIDGIEVPNPNHFGASGTTGGPVSMINNNLLTQSDFFTSAFPAEYGNAMSGVFDLKMRTGNNQKREYLGQIGFNGFEIGAEGPFKKGSKASYLVNYRYSTLGLMNAIGMDFGTGMAIPQYQDLTFKLDLPGTKLGRFSLFGMGGISYIELHDSKNDIDESDEQSYASGGSDLNFGSEIGVLGLSHLFFFNETTRLNTYVSILGSSSTTEIDSLRFEPNGKLIPNSNYKYYDSDNTEVKYSISTHLKKKFNARNNASIGAYFELYDIQYLDSVKNSDSQQLAFQKNYDISGQVPITRAYLQWQHKFSNAFTLNSGLYSQYSNLSQEITFEPRLGLNYQINQKQSLSWGYGLHSQMQPRIYYFAQSQTENGDYVQLNNNMKLSKSHQMVLGYNYLIGKDFRFKSEIYYQYLYDIPVAPSEPNFSLLNTGDSFAGFFNEELLNEGSGENYGIEFTLEKFLSKNFYFLSTISIFESKYKGYNGKERNTAFNNQYIFNVLGGYEYEFNQKCALSIDLKGVSAGGKRYIPIDLAASQITKVTEYDWDNAYEKKYNDYFRIDARISFKLNGKHINQEWALDLQNLSSHKNIYSEAFNPRSNQLMRDYQTGFFPMFLYRIKF